MNYYANSFLRRKMPTSWSVWEALSFSTARRRGWTKCSYLWGSVSGRVSYHMARYNNTYITYILYNIYYNISHGAIQILTSLQPSAQCEPSVEKMGLKCFSTMRKIFFYIYKEHRIYKYLYILLSPIRKLQTRCQRCSESNLRLCPHCTVGRLSSL